mmetsp:Transcript_8389/g.16281  ORF Transcript_8389/g.16281 Transcript_8389/m.16281 type:complete len:81 (+) Transcript_8389:1446-1688(+)
MVRSLDGGESNTPAVVFAFFFCSAPCVQRAHAPPSVSMSSMNDRMFFSHTVQCCFKEGEPKKDTPVSFYSLLFPVSRKKD